jgi:predicted small lipoprotein YifL
MVSAQGKILGKPALGGNGVGGVVAYRVPGGVCGAFAVVIVAALSLAGCGRNGPLELPPGPAGSTTSQSLPPPSSSPMSSMLPTSAPAPDVPGTPITAEAAANAARTGFDSRGNPVAGPGPKRPFILDPLLQ